MKLLQHLLCVLLIVVCGFQELHATHLIGGSLSYEYLGQNPDGTYRYRIFATTYTDCGPTSNVPDPEATIPIGIYINDLAAPNANKILASSLVVPLISVEEIQPELPSSCTVAADVCVREGYYEAFVNLPLNFGGYWLFYDRCCRNDAVVNLPQQQGVGFTTYIPSPLVVNNSPFFNAPPTPYICAGDTATFLNTAVDPDGDLLVFSFIAPLRGYSSAVTPNPGAIGYPNPLNWPVPQVTYSGGYNVNQPFGTGSYAFINGATGLTQYYAQNSGQYAVAVEIREYRDGNLIGITRRDLQILVINCPPNPPPNITANGSGETIFEVNEGEQICFPVTVSDQNGDSLIMTSAGEVFDVAFVDPAATINTPLVGDGMVEADFCWFTSCEQGRDNAYFFSATATDNGCPPKSANVVYTINVIPFNGSSFIDGGDTACEFSTETYGTDLFANGDYVWTVSGGTIINGQGTNEIDIEWGPMGVGEISVTSTNGIGCVGDPFDKEIPILPLPSIDAGNAQEICLGDTITIGGSPTGPDGSFYIWTPNSTIIGQNTANPQVHPISSGMYEVTVVSAANCSALDSVEVTVNVPILVVSSDPSICEGSTTQLTASGGVSYTWTPDVTLDDGSLPDPTAMPNVSTTYTVVMIDGNSCEAIDSVQVSVFEVPIANAGIDSVFCGSVMNLTAIPSVGNGQWTFPSEIQISPLTSPNGAATASTEGTYTLTWTETNGGICIDADQVELTFIDQPVAIAGVDEAICGLDYSALAVVSVGTGTWNFPPGITVSDVNNPNANITADAYGEYTLTWTELNVTCSDSDDLILTFVEQPLANAGSDDQVCGDSYSLAATPSAGTGQWTGPNGVTFDDVNDPNSGITTNVYGALQLTWTEDNENGCIDQASVTVIFDQIPTANAGEDQEVCGLMIDLEASTDLGTGTWVSPAGYTLDDLFSGTSGITADIPGDITLTWTVDFNGCLNADEVMLTFLATPSPDAGDDEELCIASSIVLNATGGDTYEWSPAESLNNGDIPNPTASPDTTTTYTVTISLDNGCSGTDEMTLIVHAIPDVDAGEDLGYLCAGDSIQLNATPGLISYSWSPITGLSDAGISNPYAAPNTATVIDYVVTVTDSNGCMNTDDIQVTVNPIVPTSAGSDTTICHGDPVILGASPTSPGNTTYSWFPNVAIDDTTSANPTVFPETTTTYIVSSANSICTGQDTVTIIVETIPNLPFLITATPSCEGLNVRFVNGGTEDYGYSWNLGDGTTSIEFSPAHEYPFNGEYIVVLTGTSDLGCEYFADALVDANDFTAYFPIELVNVLTPNGDGVNDVLDTGLRGTIEDCVKMEVFNRWGEIVFRSSGSNTLWDGRTPGGELVSSGVYFYYIELHGSQYKGSVQVSY
jgi:gliding motility-associated-like protein